MMAGPQLHAGPGCLWYANGVLVEPDAGVFSSVLCELAEQPEQVRRMGEAGAQFVRSHFDVETQMRALDTLYRDLLHSKAFQGRPVERSETVDSCTP
jgi:glycosyltransferase involved in cell wall biosynthesis